MPKYIVRSPIKSGGKIRATGSIVELDEETAAPLIGVELEVPAKPAEKQGGDKKAGGA